MKDSFRILTFLLSTFLLSISNPGNSVAQKRLDWHANFGVGITDMRDFGSSIENINYQIVTNEGEIDYRVKSKPDFLLNAGLGISGDFTESGILGWDAGLNIRTAAFRLTPNLLKMEGTVGSPIDELLPDFGSTKSFRYWALHVPVSLNYIPFEVIGFTVGADVYYQLSSDPSKPSPDEDYPSGGRLGRHMGMAPLNNPKYEHPFQLGAHLGLFVPVGEKLRLDAQVFTDISPRLSISRSGFESSSENKFREMGLMVNIRYQLGW